MDMTIKVQESTDEEIKRIEDTISLYWAKELPMPRIIDPTGRECAVVDWDTGYILWGYSGKEREEWRRWLDKMLATEVCTYTTRFDTFGAGSRPSVRMGSFRSMYIKGDTVTFGVYDSSKPAQVLDHTDTHITIKHPGQSYFAMRGVQGYAPAEITVYDISGAEHRVTDSGCVYRGNMPVTAGWEVRSKARHENCRACKKLQS
jgi:hypothetical protein